MSDRRLIDPTILSTDFSTAKAVGAKLLLDSNSYVEAKNIPIELLGNSFIQGSVDGIAYSDIITSSTQYLKISTNGGTNYKVLPIVETNPHNPLTLNVTNGLNLNETSQILSLNLATISEAGALSATDKVKIDKIITIGDGLAFLSNDGTYKAIDNNAEANTASSIGTGVSIIAGKVDADLRFKSFKSSDNSIAITGTTNEIDLTVTGLGGGEANTASNIGTGVGIFDNKNGINLEFKNLNPLSSKLSIVLDDINHNVDLDVEETNIDHDNLLNFVSTKHIDHSLVSVIAGIGLTGTGTLESDITLDINVDGLTEISSPEGTDYLILYDPDTLTHYKVQAANVPIATLWNNITGDITNNVDLQNVLDTKTDKTIRISTVNGLTGGGTLDSNKTFGLDFNGLSTVTPALNDVLAIYDVSNSIHAKMTVETLANFILYNGWNYSTQTLSGTTPTLDVTSGLNAEITLTGNTVIILPNLSEGMSGNIDVTNGASVYTLTLDTGGTVVISPSLTFTGDAIDMSGSSKIDCLSWWYTGSKLFVNGTYDYQ